MDARVITTHIQPDKLNEALSTYQTYQIPALKQQTGFQEGFLLTDANTGKTVGVTLWDTAAAMRAVETSGRLQEQIARFISFFTTPPVTEHYTVSIHVAGAARHARLVTGQIQPGKMDEWVRIHRDTVVPARQHHRGFQGMLVLTDTNTGKAITITQWETEADMLASESGSLEQVPTVVHLLAGPIFREHYQVSGRV
jgi:heme-degrading monooxygenase HmoA